MEMPFSGEKTALHDCGLEKTAVFPKWRFVENQDFAHQSSGTTPVTECTVYSFCGSVCRAHSPLCTQKEFEKS